MFSGTLSFDYGVTNNQWCRYFCGATITYSTLVFFKIIKKGISSFLERKIFGHHLKFLLFSSTLFNLFLLFLKNWIFIFHDAWKISDRIIDLVSLWLGMLVSPNFVIQFDFPKDLGFDHDRIFNGDANALGQLHYVE